MIADARARALTPGEGNRLLDLDHLMKATLPRPVRHDAPGVFVDNLERIVPDDVVFVELVEVQGGQCLTSKFLSMHFRRPNPAPGLGSAPKHLAP